MKLIALILGLIIERTATRALHLRELRWLDFYFDRVFLLVNRVGSPLAVAIAMIAILLPAFPVVALEIAFADVLAGLVYIGFAALVLLFSLGPRDLGKEVDLYADAVAREDQEAVRRLSKELTESDVPREWGRRVLAVEEAVLVQANNRIFGVIFWFMVLGAAGAWLFRVADLMRRRAVFEAGRAHDRGEPEPAYLFVSQAVFGVIAWVPSRLLALGYAMAGSFEDAVSDWKQYYETCSDKFFHVNEEILACAGRGAIREQLDPEHALQPVLAAMKLVTRTLLIWVTAISILTISIEAL
jgi:AmpE protein